MELIMKNFSSSYLNSYIFSVSLANLKSLFPLAYEHNNSYLSNSWRSWGLYQKYFLYILTVAAPVFLALKIAQAYCQHSILKTKSYACLMFFFGCLIYLSTSVSCTPANYNPPQIILYLALLPKAVVLQLPIWMTAIYNHWCQSLIHRLQG